MESKERFGQHLRQLREAAGITQATLASFCKLSKQYISDIEKGNNLPPRKVELLDKIIACLNLNNDQAGLLKDRAAIERGDIATDIKLILINNPDEIKKLRRHYAK